MQKKYLLKVLYKEYMQLSLLTWYSSKWISANHSILFRFDVLSLQFQNLCLNLIWAWYFFIPWHDYDSTVSSSVISNVFDVSHSYSLSYFLMFLLTSFCLIASILSHSSSSISFVIQFFLMTQATLVILNCDSNVYLH